MAKTKISVVILNWNNYEETASCLSSVDAALQKSLSVKVILVDNGSDKDQREKLVKINPKNIQIEYVLNKKNFGFTKGNNIGLKKALEDQGELVVVLNNDTRVDKNFFDECASFFKNHDTVGVMSPKIYFEKGYEFHKDKYRENQLGKVIWAAGGKIDWNNVVGVNRGIDSVDSGQFENGGVCDFASGACCVFRKNALKKVGFFDERYFMYFEDVNMGVKLKKNGWKVYYNPKAIIWHKVARSSSIGGALNDYFITRNRLLFGFSYAPVRSKFALFRESIKLLFAGRVWQRVGVRDFYLGRLCRGSWK